MNLSLKDKKDLTLNEVYDIMRVYLSKNQELSLRKVIDEENFNKPAWGEYQAYQLGMIKAFQKIIDFIPDQGAK